MTPRVSWTVRKSILKGVVGWFSIFFHQFWALTMWEKKLYFFNALPVLVTIWQWQKKIEGNFQICTGKVRHVRPLSYPFLGERNPMAMRKSQHKVRKWDFARQRMQDSETIFERKLFGNLVNKGFLLQKIRWSEKVTQSFHISIADLGFGTIMTTAFSDRYMHRPVRSNNDSIRKGKLVAAGWSFGK